MRDTLTTRALRWLLAAAFVYTGVLLVRYFLPPHVPRYQVESAFIAFAAIGLLAVLLRPGGDPPSDAGVTMGRWAAAALIVAFVAVASAIYAPAFGLGWLSDDFVLADWAARREFVHYAETGFVRPGVPLVWAALDRLPGAWPPAAHAANVVLHAVNAVLVAIVARRMRVGAEGSLVAGVVFLAFPGLSEAVVWASGAQDVLMTTLVLAAVALATSADRRGSAGALVATVFALAVKETAVVVPLLVALVVWGRGDRVNASANRRTLAALLLVSAAYVVGRLALGVPSTFLAVTDWRYFAKQLVAGAFAAVGAPWTDVWARAHPGRAFNHALAILVLTLLACHAWRRRDARFSQAVAAAAWVLVGVIPVFSLFYVGPFLEGGRYVYLSAAGFSIFLAVTAVNAAAFDAVWVRRGALALLTAVLTLPILPAIAHDLERWRSAAALRDEILARAREQVRGSSCGSFTAEGLADNVEGAFVFRHGLLQALGSGDRPGVPCRLAWTGRDVIIDPAAP